MDECCHEVRAQSLKEHCKNASTQFLQLRSKRYLLCLGSLMFDLFSEDFPQLQTNKPNLKHLSPLVSHLNFYSCGIFHIKGEVGKGLKNLSSTNHSFRRTGANGCKADFGTV